jgi:hypothetical protein
MLLFDLFYLNFIQPACSFFAVAADERNRSAFTQKVEGTAYLFFRYA